MRELQPNAVIFSDIGPDVRWVGNESGVAGETCWASYDPQPLEAGGAPAPGATRYHEAAQGHGDGSRWMPAEADVSIRPGWFYHENENDRVKTPGELFELYLYSVGRGAALLLNVPPDRRGQIQEVDEASLRTFGELLRETFGQSLAQDAHVEASRLRGGMRLFDPDFIVDGDASTYWTTDDGIRKAQLTLALPEPRTFNIVGLREYLPLGQRVDEWAVDALVDGYWREIARGESIGSRSLVRVDEVTTDRVRVRIERAAACPAISEVGLYREGAEE